MFRRYGSFLFWMLGALIIIWAFYAATARLWKATEESRAMNLETNIVSSAMGDIAEGNLLRFGSTLSKLQRDGQIRFAQILHVGGKTSTLFQTAGYAPADDATLAGFDCRSPHKFFKSSGGGIGLITVLPTRISGGQCDILHLAAEMPEDLRRFKDRLASMLTVFIAAILGFFSFITIIWHRRVVQLEIQNSLIQAEHDAEIGRIASQVAHDIRSPLAALEVVQSDIAQLPEDKRLLINSAVGRIRDIANSLLDRQRAPAPASEAAASPRLLAPLIEPVIAEKRLQFRSLPRVTIALLLDASSSTLSASVAPIEFQRILSNLINNAVESFGDGAGTVEVSLSAQDGRARVSVKDHGKGIPHEVLAKLGRRGETHGKAGGSGLGLHHARTGAESWGGKLELTSEPGKGTTATLILPSAPAPEAGRERYDAVLIDDDALARLTWKTAAARAGKKFQGFASVGEFLAAINTIDRSTPVYIDADLGDGVKGDQESVQIHSLGFRDIFLATGYSPETFAGLKHLRGVVGKEAPWA